MFGDLFNYIVGYTRLIDPSYWTLTVELLFYIGIGLFTYLLSAKNIRYFFGFWLLFSMVAFKLGIDHNFFIKLLLVRHASYFIFGGSLFLLFSKAALTLFQKYFDYFLLFSSGIYATYIHPRALEPYYVINSFDINIIYCLHILFFLLVPLLVYFSTQIKNQRVVNLLTILGGITYPLYLLHQKIGNAVINYISGNFNVSWSHLSIGFEIFIIIVAFFVYVEDKKLRQWLKEKLFK